MPAIETPPPLLEVIDDLVARVRVGPRAQTEALAELFELFTRERGQLHRLNYLDTPRLRSAYLRYHLPLNTARTLCVLEDLATLVPDLPRCETIVDLGAGPGSSSVAALLRLPAAPRRYILTDRSGGALRAAREVLAGCARRSGQPEPKVVCRQEKLPELPAIPSGSLVLMGMVLNELRPRPREGIDVEHLVRRLERRLPPGTVLAIIEPALRAPGLRLLELHDRLVESSGWEILAPCTHQRTCPLLRARGRPWCHFHFDWRAGPSVESIARPLGLHCEKGALAYLVARRRAPSSRSEDVTSAPPDLGRVIGDPMRTRDGGRGAYVCQGGRRETVPSGDAGLLRGDRIRDGGGSRRRRETVRVVSRWGGRD